MTDNQSHDNQEENDDVVFEEEPSDDVLYEKKDREKKLREKLSECQKERQEYLQGWQRSKADLINARREFDSERERIRMLACERLIEDLLPVLDSFDMAMKDKKMWESLDNVWRQGMEHIYREFRETLTSHGLESIDPIGEPFNPAQHESVSSKPTPKGEEEGVVAEVVQKGYALKSKIIRAPKVVIYQNED